MLCLYCIRQCLVFSDLREIEVTNTQIHTQIQELTTICFQHMHSKTTPYNLNTHMIVTLYEYGYQVMSYDATCIMFAVHDAQKNTQYTDTLAHTNTYLCLTVTITVLVFHTNN